LAPVCLQQGEAQELVHAGEAVSLAAAAIACTQRWNALCGRKRMIWENTVGSIGMGRPRNDLRMAKPKCIFHIV